MNDAPDKEHPQPTARREALFRWLMIAVFGGAVLVYFVAHVFETPLQADNFTNSYSKSPGGHAALVELLTGEGRDVTRQSGRIELPEGDNYSGDTLVMLEPGPEHVEYYGEEFRDTFEHAMARESSVVISLPKRSYDRANPQPEDSEEVVLYEALYSEFEVTRVLERTGMSQWFAVERIGPTTVTWQPGYADPIKFRNDTPTQVLVPRRDEEWLPSQIEILARAEDGQPVIVRHRPENDSERGGIILISDPDFLTNRYIDGDGAARVIVEMFKLTPPAGTLIVNEDVHGFSTDATLEYLAFTPPGLWITLSVILLLLLFGWRQATVLRPQDAEPQDRRARKYAIEGLARMMERARDHHTAYRRVIKRARLVLGAGHSQVLDAGGGTGVMRKGKTGKIQKLPGGTDEERLVNAARRIAHQVRTGETEHSDWTFDDQGQT